MQVDTTEGRIRGARWVPSPNCDERPHAVEPSLLVVHGISLPPTEYGGPWIDQFFCNTLDPAAHPYFAEIAALRVSAHLLIRRTGVLVQYVSFDHRAWHAGQSCFAGREACNDFSIGVELEGCDDEAYCVAQYHTLAEVYQALVHAYPEIAKHPVVGHSDIAPGRKSDPGPAFDWAHFESMLRARGVALTPRATELL